VYEDAKQQRADRLGEPLSCIAGKPIVLLMGQSCAREFHSRHLRKVAEKCACGIFRYYVPEYYRTKFNVC